MVTAAEILAVAVFREGKFAQAFPSFGSERMGAPVVSFCRVDEQAIRLREPVTHPDVVVVQDPTLLASTDVFAGVGDDGWILINSKRDFAALGLGDWVRRFRPGRVRCLPATDLARLHLGRPLPGAALLGGLAGLTALVRLESLAAAIRERFPAAIGDGNVAAATAAYQLACTEPASC